VLSKLALYYGQRLALRGYFILQDRETKARLEPDRRKASNLVSIQRLPAATAQQVLDSRMKPVDVQGHPTHVRTRGGEAALIFAEAMGEAAE
jgi:hypothetical protein